MVTRALALAMLCACQPQVGGGEPIDAAEAPWLAGFSYRRPIEVKPPVAEPLADFPLAIVIPSDPALAAHVSAGGADLVVTGADGVTPLAAELAGFELASGALELWVRLPSLDGPTRLHLYYGGVGGAADPRAVWAGYAGVWHLSDTGAGAKDSTDRAHDLRASPGEPQRTRGIAGNARNHDGVDDGLAIGDPVDGSLDFGLTSVSYSIWVKEGAAVGTYDTAFYKGGTATSQPGYCMLLGTGAWTAKVHDGVKFFEARLGNEVPGAWVHLAAVVDRDAKLFRGYVNGALTDEVDIAALNAIAGAEPFEIGRSATELFRGNVDEVRIYSGVRSGAQIAAEYANLASPSFLVIGDEQSQ